MTGTAGHGLGNEGREGVARSGLPGEHHSTLEALSAALVLIPSNLHMHWPRHPKGGAFFGLYSFKTFPDKIFSSGEKSEVYKPERGNECHPTPFLSVQDFRDLIKID